MALLGPARRGGGPGCDLFIERRARLRRVHEQEGRAWLEPYARVGSLLSGQTSVIGQVVYSSANSYQTTIAQAFIAQGLANGEASQAAAAPCGSDFASLAGSADVVVEPCDPTGQNCANLGSGQIDAHAFMCEPPEQGAPPLDDLAVALTGMHPKDVWVQRFEANLPRAALDQDLELSAALDQSLVDNWRIAAVADNPPCAQAPAAATLPPPRASGRRPPPRGMLAIGIALLGLASLLVRRASRAPLLLPARA
jgi:hypothetical protein